MKAFISGPMTGFYELNFPTFRAAEEELITLGYEALNPAALFECMKVLPSPQDCTRMTMKMLLEADVVFVLPDWYRSKGSLFEVEVAMNVGMKIYDINSKKEYFSNEQE